MVESLSYQQNGFILNADFHLSAQPSEKPLLFCLPGGGANKGFFDLAPDFSFAKRMNAMGYDVVTMDHPGTASNPIPVDHPFLTPYQSADYIAKALRSWSSGRQIVGIGHSMGGMISTMIQSRHGPYKALALLGSSAGGLDWGLTEAEKTYIEKPEDFLKDIESLTLNKFGSEFPLTSAGPSGKSITFGAETPELLQRLQEITCELFAAGGMMSMTRGSFRKDVEALDIPLFFAFGDHDIGIPPKDAPKDYINAASTELLVLDNTGHNSLAFSSIATLCERLDHWISTSL